MPFVVLGWKWHYLGLINEPNNELFDLGFENLTSLKNVFEVGLFTSRTDLGQAFNEPNMN